MAAAPAVGLHHVGVAVRCFGVALVLAAIVAAMLSGDGWSAGISILVGCVVLLLTVETRNPLTLRNFFLVYTVGLFTLGAALLDLATIGLIADLILFVSVFLAGYTLSSLRLSRHPVEHEAPPSGAVSPERVRFIEELLVVFIGLNLLLLAWRISRYGVSAFYSGAALEDLHTSYGQASVSGGIEQIVTFFLKYTALAAIVLYVQTSLRNEIKIQYRYPLLLLVGLPILSLARSEAVIGASLLLAIYGVEGRVTTQARQARAREPDRELGPATASRPAPRRTLVIAVTVIVALAAGMVIGGIRQNRLSPQPGSSALERSAPLLKSEFGPIQAYSEIKQYEAVLGHTHGSTVVAPLLLKLVPRAFFPGKPLNSGAYYMSIVRPNEFAANFALPPTLFGDAFINFGMAGAIVLCLLLGIVVARLDLAYRKALLARLPWFLIVFANFYALLRSPLSESLAGLLITSTVWLMLRPLGNARPEPPAPSGRRSRRSVGVSQDQRRILDAV